MGTSAVILTHQNTYSPEKLLADTIVSVFHADASLYYDNNKDFFAEGEFLYTTLNINNGSFSKDQAQSMVFSIPGIHDSSIEFYYHEDLELDSTLQLYQVGHIENIYGVQSLIFSFIYEYLKLNPNDYFWITDYDWVYSWEDMQHLKLLPYDPKWCYKNPKG
ncbi:hypothetical protein [Paenibacillus hunanensis]|uniref:Uncharacterized protein n=1 Tax=Paenibacillus hunanensis TaxID=539262 RepID=A0ABU1J1D3_9BACL|nr:hypothetical protein [Paenibacillus hunanensis]MDR6244996.1 hypothetical protein [Paenibacillus hunanensis]GGI95904.1 hypothetical protein GCM10008022_00480 [Paenibacillus hunanensis]